MKPTRAWPSRRLQIAVLVGLAVIAALVVFVPPLSRAKRAEQLYEDAWFLGMEHGSFDSDAVRNRAVSMLDKALTLAPGNSLYEQALVWRCPKDKLPQLLKDHKLGREAERLAAGRMYMPSEQQSSFMYSLHKDPSNALKRKDDLASLGELKKCDPGSALPAYLKAFVLIKDNRPDEALDQIRAGNRIGKVRWYIPDLSQRVLSSGVGAYVTPDFPVLAKLRETARGMVDLSNKRLMAGRVNEACEPLEECCRMGVNIARAEPHSSIPHLVGMAVFAIGWSSLDPICKDFDMKDKLRTFSSISQELVLEKEAERTFVRGVIGGLAQSMISVESVPMAIAVGISLSICILLGGLIDWWIAAIIRRRRQQEILTFSAWGEGWVTKMSLFVYVPVFAASVLRLTVFRNASLTAADNYNFMYYDIASLGLMALAQIAMLAAAVRILLRTYNDHVETKAGLWRFLFLGPASMRAWAARNMCAFLGIQTAFLIGCALLTIIVFKPVTGIHPWQMFRIQDGMIPRERVMVGRLSANLTKVIPSDWR